MTRKAFPEQLEKAMVIATIYEPKEASKGFTVGDRVRGKFMRQARNIYSDAKKLKLPTVTGTIRLESRDLNPSQGEANDYRPDPQAEQEIVLRLTFCLKKLRTQPSAIRLSSGASGTSPACILILWELAL